MFKKDIFFISSIIIGEWDGSKFGKILHQKNEKCGKQKAIEIVKKKKTKKKKLSVKKKQNRSKEIKRTICKKCNNLNLSQDHFSVRSKNKVTIKRCKMCENTTRFPHKKKKQSEEEKRDELSNNKNDDDQVNLQKNQNLQQNISIDQKK